MTEKERGVETKETDMVEGVRKVTVESETVIKLETAMDATIPTVAVGHLLSQIQILAAVPEVPLVHFPVVLRTIVFKPSAKG